VALLFQDFPFSLLDSFQVFSYAWAVCNSLDKSFANFGHLIQASEALTRQLNRTIFCVSKDYNKAKRDLTKDATISKIVGTKIENIPPCIT